ncbi:uncharacterized protein LOC144137722 [Haemaphysalis longicornis]
MALKWSTAGLTLALLVKAAASAVTSTERAEPLEDHDVAETETHEFHGSKATYYDARRIISHVLIDIAAILAVVAIAVAIGCCRLCKRDTCTRKKKSQEPHQDVVYSSLQSAVPGQEDAQAPPPPHPRAQQPPPEVPLDDLPLTDIPIP